MADIMKILLRAQIDRGSIGDIQRQIEKISKNSQAIKINIDIDDKIFKNIENINKQLSKIDLTPNVKLGGLEGQLNKLTVVSKGAKDEQDSLSKVIKEVGISSTETMKIVDVYNSKTGDSTKSTKTLVTNLKKQREEQATLIGTFKELKKEQISSSDVANILSRQYGGLEVRGKSLNLTTGQYNVTLKQSAKENLVLKGTVDNVTGALRVQNETVKQARSVQLGFWEQMKIALTRFPIWMGASTIFFQTIRSITRTVKDITELNKHMIDLEKVTTATREELDRFYQSAPKLGKQLGVLTTDVIETTAAISRLGYSLSDSRFLTELSLIGKTVGDLENTGDAVDYLTSIIKGFRLETTEGTNVLDFLNHTANTTSINFAALGEGFKRMSAAMSEGNNTLAESAGLLVSGYDIVRNAEMVSTALRTTSLRLRGVSEDGEDLSDLVPSLEKKFNSFGLSLQEDNDTFKSTFDILKDVAAIWDDISDIERASLLEDIAGKRNSQVVAAVIQNMQTAIDVANSFEESQGSAILEHQRYMEGVEYAYNRMQGSLTELHNVLLKSQTLIKGLNLVNAMIENTTALGKFSLVLGATTVALGAFSLANRKAIKDMTNLQIVSNIGSMRKFATDVSLAIKMLLGFDVGLKKATISATALNVATSALLLGIPLIAQGIGIIISRQKRLKEEMDEAVESFKRQSILSDSIDDLISSYKELEGQASRTAEEEEKLLKIKERIIELLPESASVIDNENLSLKEQVEILESLNEQELQRAKLEAQKVINKYGSTYERDVQFVENFNNQIDELQSKIDELNTKKFTVGLTGNEEKELKKLTKALEENIEKRDKHLAKTEAIEEAERLVAKATLGATQSILIETIAISKNAEEREKAKKTLLDYGFTLEEIESSVKSYRKQVETIGDADGFEIQAETLEDLTKKYEEITSKIQDYYIILDELNSKEKISEQTKQEIITKHQELLPYISDEQELRRQLIMIIAQEEKAQRTAYAEMLMVSEHFYNAKIKGNKELVEKLSEYYGVDLERYKSLAEAKSAIEAKLMHNLASKWAQFYDAQRGVLTYDFTELQRVNPDEANKILEEVRRLNRLKSELENLALDLGGIDFKGINMSKIKDPKEKKDKKDNRQFLDSIDAEIRAIQSRNDHLEKTADLLQEQLDLAKEIEGIEGSSKQYELTGQIIEHNTKLLQSYKDEQDAIHKKANDIRKQYSKYNIDSWFDANAEQTVAYINQYNGATKEQQEEMQKVFSQVQKLKQAWMGANDAVKNVLQTNKELTRELESHPSKIRDYVRELIEAEKRNAYLELEMRQRRANEELEQARQQMENEVEYYQSRIKSIQNEIDRMQESERARQERLERAKRLEEIAELQNKYYTLQYKSLSSLTEEQAKALGLEKEREQYLKRQAKMQELLIKLENVRKEKNIQQLAKQQDGTWQFEYVADEREIDNINKQIEDLQEEHNKTLKDLKERTLDDLKRAQEEYDEWERQNRIRRQIEEKQRRIQEYQDEITDLQNKFAEKERLTNEAFEREKENLDRYYMDIDILTDERMKELYETFNGSWTNIYNMLVGYFDDIRREYKELVDVLSQPLPTPEFGMGGGTGEGGGRYSDGGSDSGSSRSSNSSGGARDGYTRMRKPNGGTTQVIDGRVDDLIRKGWSVLHEGGVVGDGSRDLPEFANKLFNTKADEQMVKAKIGELFVPKENLAKYFVPNMQKLFKSVVLSTVNLATPKVPNVALSSVGNGDTIYYINEMKLPNATDFDSFRREFDKQVVNLPNKAIMKIRKIGG